MNELYEKILADRPIFQGKVLDVHLYTVERPDGRESYREVALHGGGAGILALNHKGEALFVRQFRLASGEALLEVPAGRLEAGEDPLRCAQRELREETGYTAKKWQPLGAYYVSPGYTSEKLHLYFAEDLTPGSQELDDGEFLEIQTFPMKEALEMLHTGQIRDAKTALCLSLCESILAQREQA